MPLLSREDCVGRKGNHQWAEKHMKERRLTGRVVIKYTLIQIPGTVFFILLLQLLRQWVDIPRWLLWGLVGLWVAKEIVLFPFVRRAYESGDSEPGKGMVGEKGIAEEFLNPSGYVRIRGELWRAEVRGEKSAVEKGKTVRIHSVHGLTLVVEPELEGDSDEM